MGRAAPRGRQRGGLTTAARVAAVLSLHWLHCVSPPPAPPSPGVASGELHLARGESALAVRAFRTALNAAPDDASARRGLLRSLVARAEPGDGEAALSEWDELEEPDLRCRALELAARDGVAAGRESVAADALADHEGRGCDAAKRSPLAAAIWTARAQRLGEAGDDEAALEGWARVRALAPSLVAAYLQPAELLLSLGRRDAAIVLLSEGLAQRPEAPALQALMVRALGARAPAPSLP